MRNIALILSLLAACSEQPAEHLIAHVGPMPVHRASVEAAVGRPLADAKPTQVDAALVGLVGTARQAAAAHAAGLHTDPKVLAQLEEARQRVLARAWRHHTGDAVDEADVVTRFEEEKAALTERVYDLDFIRIKIRDGNRLLALNAARTAYARLRNGTPFAQVARGVSDDAPSRARGGYLGKVAGRRLPPMVKERLDAMTIGVPTPPLELPDAIVIARLRTETVDRPPELAHVAPRLRAQLRTEATALDKAILAERFPVQMHHQGGVQ